MALATPMRRAFESTQTLDGIVFAASEIASVLAEIHERGFSHRDIKPENLFLHDGQWAVGDFGLAAFDGKSHETAQGEKLGPLHYIAPEMLNDSVVSDGRPADVFSIAKTLWVLATGQKYPLPGPYSAATPMCRLGSYNASHRTELLDALIERCSAMEPNSRPRMSEVAEELKAWLRLPKAGTVGPLRLTLGAAWSEIESAANRERERVRHHNAIHELKHAAIRQLEERLMARYAELRDTLAAAHFVDIEGADRRTSPPGVKGWLPSKSSKNNRVGIEVRAWFTFDWQQLESREVGALLRAQLLLLKDGVKSIETLHESKCSFLLGGSKEEATVHLFLTDIADFLEKWVAAAYERRELLG